VEVEVPPSRFRVLPLFPLLVVVLWGLVGERAAFGASGASDPVSFCSLRVVEVAMVSVAWCGGVGVLPLAGLGGEGGGALWRRSVVRWW